MDLDDKLVELPEEVGKAFSSDTEYVLLDHIGGGGSRIVHRGWDEN